LASTHFSKATLAQDSIHAKSFVCNRLSFEPFPLKISIKRMSARKEREKEKNEIKSILFFLLLIIISALL
jgi:dolichol kinase